MHVSRRPVTLFVTAAVVAVVAGSVLGATTHSDAAPAPAAVSGNPKVPSGAQCCGYAYLRPGDRLDSSDPERSGLKSGGLTTGGAGQVYTTTPYSLRLQSDGNLVEYAFTSTGATRAVWSTGTRSTTPVTLTFQSDGNVVLRNRAGQALWSTGTAGRPAVWFDVYGNGQIVTQDSTGHVISAHGPAEVAMPGIGIGGALSPAWEEGGPEGALRSLVVQADGNLVEYVFVGTSKRAVWSTRTSGVGPVRLDAQSDGNLVLRQLSTGRAVWTSGAKGGSAYYQLDLQDDGNLVLYRTDGIRRGQAVWATGIRN